MPSCRHLPCKQLDSWFAEVRRHDWRIWRSTVRQGEGNRSHRPKQEASVFATDNADRNHLWNYIEFGNTDDLSASEHVRGVIRSRAQNIQEMRVLRSHAMCDTARRTVFWSVIVAKLLYACNAFRHFSPPQQLAMWLLRNVPAIIWRRLTSCSWHCLLL